MISRILRNKAIYNVIFMIMATGALFGVLFLRSPVPTQVDESGPTISVDGKHIPVSVADTPQLREQGLSGTASLSRGSGKLFIFDTPGIYGFWMKDMAYPIDIVWIDDYLRVVDITVSATPESYPSVFYPQRTVQYVLEMNAHEAREHGIGIGTQLQFNRQ